MAKEITLVGIGEVVYVEGDSVFENADHAGAKRIKVRMDSDRNLSDDDLPYAIQLGNPMFQCLPKVGEAVYVFTERVNNVDSQRFYLGPVISQPQYMEKCPYKGGRGPAATFVHSGKVTKAEPEKSINNFKECKGAFPAIEDVAIIGRGQEDIILKYRRPKVGSDSSEILLRAGIRTNADESSLLKGNVIFNSLDPAYIQVRHSNKLLSGVKGCVDDNSNYDNESARQSTSLINLVGGKINLISASNQRQNHNDFVNPENLIDDEKIDEIMSKLHRLPYGDELVSILEIFRRALSTHVHAHATLTPIIKGTPMEQLMSENFEKILSPDVRIS